MVSAAGGGFRSTINDAFRGDIAWTNVKVMPGVRAQFPVEPTPNHYFVARETDAAPLTWDPSRNDFCSIAALAAFRRLLPRP